ncbi:MAG: class I SAM-dependent methyltransferase [Oscillospiraceae bacterium]
MMIEHLDKRLWTVASLVRPGVRLADVGCDHGRLICALAQDGVIAGGVACDINEKPLSKAREKIAQSGLESRLTCRLSDGLSSVSSNEVDDVVIAGMGGETIAEILSACVWKDHGDKHFLLQPMTCASYLRNWLCANGFALEIERAAEAAGRTYSVMCVRYTGEIRHTAGYDPFVYVGALPDNPSPEGARYIQRVASVLKHKADGLMIVAPERASSLLALSEKLRIITEGW